MKTFINILFAGALVALSSCSSNWLELKPESNIVRQDFWQTKEQVNSAVIGCYCSLLDPALAERLLLAGELRADMLYPNLGIKSDYYRIWSGDITETNTFCDWASYYKTINNCNTVIAYAKEAQKVDATFSVSQLHALEAEAYALRGLLYYYLVRTYREVPLMLEAVTSDNVSLFIKKSSESEIIDQISADLDTAALYALPTYGDNASDKGRITKYAVYALQADFALWQNKYQDCINACDQIISSQKFGLVTGSHWLDSLFIVGNSTSESIFELQFSSSKPNPYFYFHPKIGSLYFNASGSIADLYSTTDVRGKFGTYNYSGESLTAWKILAESAYDTTSMVSAASQSTKHLIMYRYADVLLMKAEALIQTDNGAEALSLIRQVQNRANSGDSAAINTSDKEEMTLMLLNERRKEFAFEGKRWFDVLRNAKRNKYEMKQIIIDMILNNAPSDQQSVIANKYTDTLSYFLPIYYKELQTNSLLEQSSYYQ
jgi:hypothetical protein